MLSKVLHYYFRLTRGMTLGVRAIIVDEQQRVLLVKQSYAKGWILPGGGVEIGETCAEAVAKEAWEEAAVKLEASPEFVAIYQQPQASPRDHVLLYHCPQWTQPEPPKVPNMEIIAVEFFPLNALPEDTIPSTRRRIEEWQNGGPYSDIW